MYLASALFSGFCPAPTPAGPHQRAMLRETPEGIFPHLYFPAPDPGHGGHLETPKERKY